MRMSEEDARTRRDHARRNGSATEYDALHGSGLYGPGSKNFRSQVRALLRFSASQRQEQVRPRHPDQGAPFGW